MTPSLLDPLDPRYAAYLDDVRRRLHDPTGRCREESLAMADAFPELRLVRGHVRCANGRRYPHWWCVDPDDVVLDPTAAQFALVGILDYEPHPDGAPEPTGKCPNCGEYCYGGRFCCSDACERAYERYLMEGL